MYTYTLTDTCAPLYVYIVLVPHHSKQVNSSTAITDILERERERERERGRERERMAGGFGGAVVSERPHQYEYRITGYFVFACIVAALGGSLLGYDLGVSGGVTSMDDFLKEFFPNIYRRKQLHLNETDYCKYNNQILTLFTSCLYFAGLISTFGASYVTRNKGRKASILVGAVSLFLIAVLNAAAKNIAMLIIRRIFLGVGFGFGSSSLVSPGNGSCENSSNQLFQLTAFLGILIANWINYGTDKIHPWGWGLSLGLATVPAVLMFVGGLFLPETPNSLVEQGRLEEARTILEKVRGTKKVDAEFANLVDASNESTRAKKSPPIGDRGLGNPSFQQLTGMNSILVYAPVIFQSLGFGSGAALYSSIFTSGAFLVATFISIGYVDTFGRRASFLAAGTEMICCLVAVTITLALKFGQGEVLPKGIGIFLVIVICIFVLAYGRSWRPLAWLVPSELFPLEMRSAGLSLIIIMNTFIFFLLPETKQVPIEEIYLLFQKHWFWKRIVGDGEQIGPNGKPSQADGKSGAQV
ncbi:hypothetical protein DVH24_017993 [Malus domestica]|uniref:Major facilitator superfamily (MFS) profile domain-containing protein n=1 Tax=Malus domestica TaxID=3750 RepID=A0A498KF70_MALDO|nr:hypothetical protein DVH24_017993 [Malus domestica]